jgi:hypothetical protein
LSYYRARYYEPTAGRFISEDPIGFRAGVDFYEYVLNNPVRFADSLGLEPLEHNPGYAPFGTPCPECEKKALNDLLREMGLTKPVCFMSCIVIGFADDIAIGGSALLSRTVRRVLASPAGKAGAKAAGYCGLALAAGYCSFKCDIIAPTPPRGPFGGGGGKAF